VRQRLDSFSSLQNLLSLISVPCPHAFPWPLGFSSPGLKRSFYVDDRNPLRSPQRRIVLLLMGTVLVKPMFHHGSSKQFFFLSFSLTSPPHS